MPSKNIHKIYMNFAETISQLSYAKTRKVGCIIVKDNNIIAEGYNGTPYGFDNDCEYLDKKENIIKTHGHVIHAESNAIVKLSKSTRSSQCATLYITLSPCLQCAKLIIQAGIKEIYYKENYNNPEGTNLLKLANIKIYNIKEINNGTP